MANPFLVLCLYPLTPLGTIRRVILSSPLSQNRVATLTHWPSFQREGETMVIVHAKESQEWQYD